MKINTVDTVIQEFRNGRDIWSRAAIELAVREIKRLRKRIAELEQERRWIPVSTPPENNDDYLTLTTDEFGDSYQEVAQYIDGFFFDQFDDKIDPTYWQSLPQPPKDGE